MRAYPWGVAEALHSSHSDAPALKRLLIELSFEDLKARTEQRYYAYRAQRLAAPPPTPSGTSGSGGATGGSIGGCPVVAPAAPAGACQLHHCMCLHHCLFEVKRVRAAAQLFFSTIVCCLIEDAEELTQHARL